MEKKMIQEIKNYLSEKMNKAINILERELSGLRVGRSSTTLIDSIVVDFYGSKIPMYQVATILAPDAKHLTVQVWDKSMVKVVEKAITNANLGLNPISDGQIIRINLPILSQERREELVKIAHRYSENAKVTLRNIRRDGIEHLKSMLKAGSISKDEQHNMEIEVQMLTNDFIEKVISYVKLKEQEILKL